MLRNPWDLVPRLNQYLFGPIATDPSSAIDLRNYTCGRFKSCVDKTIVETPIKTVRVTIGNTELKPLPLCLSKICEIPLT